MGMIEGTFNEGVFTTTADKLINWARTGSLWPMTFGLACCEIGRASCRERVCLYV